MNAWVRLILAFFIDISIRVFLMPGEWAPDLLLITIVYITMTRPVGEAYFMAFISGLIWDILFLDLLGMHAILYLIASMCAAKLRALIWGQYAISRLILGVLFSGAVRFLEVIFWLSAFDFGMPAAISQQYIAAGAVVTGIVFMLIPWVARTAPQRTGSDVPVFGRDVAI